MDQQVASNMHTSINYKRANIIQIWCYVIIIIIFIYLLCLVIIWLVCWLVSTYVWMCTYHLEYQHTIHLHGQTNGAFQRPACLSNLFNNISINLSWNTKDIKCNNLDTLIKGSTYPNAFLHEIGKGFMWYRLFLYGFYID